MIVSIVLYLFLLRCCRDEPLCAAPTTRFACRPLVTQCTDSYIHTCNINLYTPHSIIRGYATEN